MNRKGILRIAKGHHYFFVKPNSKENVYETAERLMEIRSVKEVAITEGHFGFVVKAEDSARTTTNRINRIARGTSSIVACHCHYVK